MEASVSTPPPLPPYARRDPGDAWVFGPNGEKFWGLFGAAGLLVWHRGSGILLQHRVGWSHFGGTWGLPGGARNEGESAVDGALREANEEAGVPPELVTELFTSVLDLGYWSYTTVVVEASQVFEPVIGDAESEELRWVPVDEVDSLPLHPGFAASWAELRSRLR
jgi:8-oxo-dGTP pyrophosphatase MutT (NUDIX family)